MGECCVLNAQKKLRRTPPTLVLLLNTVILSLSITIIIVTASAASNLHATTPGITALLSLKSLTDRAVG